MRRFLHDVDPELISDVGATEIGPLKRERQPKSRFNAPFRARTGTGGTADAPGGGTTGRSSGQQQNPQPSSAFTSLAGSRPPMPYDLQTPLPTRGVTSLFGHTPSFAHSSSQPSASTPKSRGRPPGAKNKNPRPEKGAPKKTSLSTDSQGNEVTPPLPRPRRVDSTPARPSGLRNALTPTDGIAVLIASPSPSVAGGGPGSKAKSKAPYVEEKSSDRHPSTPSYQIYKCLWKDCPAELHNLATLRKHVVKHGNQFGDGPFPCLWADCHDSKGAAEPGDSEQDKCPRLSFTSEAAWDRHIEGRHVNAIAWELGDGPSTRSSGKYSFLNRLRRYANTLQMPNVRIIIAIQMDDGDLLHQHDLQAVQARQHILLTPPAIDQTSSHPRSGVSHRTLRLPRKQRRG